jgi:hypothetical protein
VVSLLRAIPTFNIVGLKILQKLKPRSLTTNRNKLDYC